MLIINMMIMTVYRTLNLGLVLLLVLLLWNMPFKSVFCFLICKVEQTIRVQNTVQESFLWVIGNGLSLHCFVKGTRHRGNKIFYLVLINLNVNNLVSSSYCVR